MLSLFRPRASQRFGAQQVLLHLARRGETSHVPDAKWWIAHAREAQESLRQRAGRAAADFDAATVDQIAGLLGGELLRTASRLSRSSGRQPARLIRRAESLILVLSCLPPSKVLLPLLVAANLRAVGPSVAAIVALRRGVAGCLGAGPSLAILVREEAGLKRIAAETAFTRILAACPEVLHDFMADSSPIVRRAVVQAAVCRLRADSRDDRAHAIIGMACRDDSPLVRVAAAEASLLLASDQRIQAVATLVADSDASVQVAAATAVAGGSVSVPLATLLACADNDDIDARKAIRRAIHSYPEEIPAHVVRSWLLRASRDRRAIGIVEALARLPHAAMFADQLSSGEPGTRVAAALGLAAIAIRSDPRRMGATVVERLVSSLQVERDPAVLSALASALEQVHMPGLAGAVVAFLATAQSGVRERFLESLAFIEQAASRTREWSDRREAKA